MKTKVWIVIWGLKDGGAEVLARNYASLVDPQTFDATVVTMYPFEDTANYRHAKNAGIRILSVFRKRNTLTRMVRLLFGNWYVPLALKKMLAKEKPNTIHFNSKMLPYFTSLTKELSGIRLLYTCHNEVQVYFSGEEKRAAEYLMKNTDMRLIALHDDMKAELNQTFSKNDTVVIRNGIDLNRFRNATCGRNEMRQALGIDQEAYLVGHIGRFAKEKNHAFLLKIFQSILAKKPNAHLLLIGSGELKEQISQTIAELGLKDRVTILSHRTDIPELLHAMDVLVFPSLYEGLSVTLVEAQASGLKCVISDTINPATIMSEKTIPVSLAASPEEWADIVLSDEIKNKNYGNIEDYDMNREIRRLERLYLGEVDV